MYRREHAGPELRVAPSMYSAPSLSLSAYALRDVPCKRTRAVRASYIGAVYGTHTQVYIRVIETIYFAIDSARYIGLDSLFIAKCCGVRSYNGYWINIINELYLVLGIIAIYV